MTTRHHRRLVDHLRGWTCEQVAGLLRRRPDLARPRPPADLAELAQRAQHKPSIDAAIAAVTLPENRLLQVVACCRADLEVDELAAALPDGVALPDVDGPLSALEAAALLWRHEGRIHCSPTLRQAMPTTLGPPIELLLRDQTVEYLRAALALLRSEIGDAGDTGAVVPRASGPGARPSRKAELVEELSTLLATPGLVGAVLAAGPEDGAAIALAMADGRPIVPLDHSLSFSGSGTSGYHRRFATYRLFERALLLPVGDGRAAVQPREVGLALRGGRPVDDLALDEPVLAAAPVSPVEVDARAAARAVQALDHLSDLIEHWEQAPARTLKSGGLGATVMKQTAAALETDADETIRLVELAHLAGLIEVANVARKERRSYVHEAFVGPSPTAAAWAGRPVTERWPQLATAWLRAEHWPSASGRKGSEAKGPPVLSSQYAATAPDLRRRVLQTLATLETGTATTPARLASVVYWQCPQPWLGHDLGLGRGADRPTTAIDWVYAEAELLGVVADGALSSFGRAVLAGERRQTEEALAGALPEPGTTFTLQADLTATVVGALDRSVLAELRLLADVESTGAATTLRFSDATVRRALDAGRDGDAVLAFLEDHATKGVPKPLAYLVADVARRYGNLQVGSVGSVLTSVDPAVLADACSHRRTRKLALRLLAPTVAVSPYPGAKVLRGLRDAGFLPTVEGGGADAGGNDELDRARALDSAMLAVHEAFHRTHPRGDAGGGVGGAGTDGPGGDGDLPEPYRCRAGSHRRPTPSVDADTAAALAEAILVGRPGEAPSARDAGAAGASPTPAPHPGGGPAGEPARGSAGRPLAFPHDPAVEDDDEAPEGLDELLEWACEHRRVLGIRVRDAGDLGEQILFAVTGWKPDLLLGTDLADGAAVAIRPRDIGAVIDLGPVEDLGNVAFLGDTRSRPHRRSTRGHR